MSTVAHLGPGLARQGGPAGYLAQLDGAIRTYGTNRHRVLLPAPLARTGRSGSPAGRFITHARRLRLTYAGAPNFARPSIDDARRVDGPIGTLLGEAWVAVQDEVAVSLRAGIEAGADVLFAHDAPSAELAMKRRAPGQRVWLMMHTPMPLPLYLAWCWGVPERGAEEVAQYPDVREWTARELEIVQRVDQVLIPCAAAVDDIARGCDQFGPALSRARCVLTGGQGPARRRSGLDGPALRRSFDLPEYEPVGLFLGNPQPYRGLDVVLDALSLLPGRRDVPGVIAVAGCPPDRLPLHTRLNALGSVADVADLLATADFVINVNRFSLFDLSLIEAAQAGKPLLLHETGGNRTFAELGAGCRLLGDIQPVTVAAGIADLFRDAAGRGEMGARSRDSWERMLTPRHLRDRHVALYDLAADTIPRPA